MRFPRPVRYTRTILILLLLLSGAMTALRAAAPTRPATETKRFFWKITSPTTEVYFLGSIHVASPDMYPLPQEIEAGYKASDVLVVEADITKLNQDQLTLQMLTEGMYAQGDSLDKHLTPETLKTLKEFCATNGLPMQVLATMRPPVAAMMVEAQLLEASGLSATEGIDLHFLTAANKAKDKKIVELESADAQMKLLFAMEDKLADKWLVETMRDDTKDELAKVIKAWKEGDAKAMDADMTKDEKEDPDVQKMNDTMIYKRNDEMVKKIDAMLKGKEKVFVVVGAAHLTGDKGLLKLLEGKGYKVERPTLTAPPARVVESARP